MILMLAQKHNIVIYFVLLYTEYHYTEFNFMETLLQTRKVIALNRKMRNVLSSVTENTIRYQLPIIICNLCSFMKRYIKRFFYNRRKNKLKPNAARLISVETCQWKHAFLFFLNRVPVNQFASNSIETFKYYVIVWQLYNGLKKRDKSHATIM